MKKPIQVIIWIIIFIAAAAIAYFLVIDNNSNDNVNVATDSTYPVAGDYSHYLLDFLIMDNQDGKLEGGQYNTDGFVVDKTNCPPCPKDAVCMPCPPDAIFIAEQMTTEPDKQLKILVENLDQFNINQRYVFSLEISEITKEISLLGYSEMN